MWTDDELQRVLLSWEGTPYMKGQQVKGVGVDCWRFVDAVMAELHGIQHEPLPRIAPDLNLHSSTEVYRLVKLAVGRYPHRLLKSHEPVLPGDSVIVKPSAHAGPGHILVAGVEPNSLWHAINGLGVARTSLAVAGHLYCIYRPLERQPLERQA